MIEDSTLRELFRAESEEHLQRLDDALLQLEKNPADQALLEDAFREAHSLKGAARMLGLSALQGPAHRLEDQFNAARHAAPALDVATIAQMSTSLASLRQLTAQALANGQARERASAVPGSPTAAVGAADAGASAKPAELLPVAATQPASPAHPSDPAPAPPSDAAAPASAAFQIESVRVDTRKLDALMTHAGELMVTRSRLAAKFADLEALIELNDEWLRSQTARRLRSESASGRAALDWVTRMGEMLAELRGRFAEDSARLHNVATELEGGIRQSRLVPLSGVFRLFPRLVHDLGQEQGKPVELVIEGEETVADKYILEEIKDPLMHLLRNAIDHGIESAPEREQLGKPATAALRIQANQSGASVIIEVSDDGRGLDLEAIKRAAAKRGIASAEALAVMSPERVQTLVFQPGMSTAPIITELSGRGVGMGVVQANVARLKGAVELWSSPGLGTRVTLRLPVTLTTQRLLIARVNGHAYGLPMPCVQSLQTLARSELFTLEGRSALQYQGRAVSVARLADLLQLAPARALRPDQGACVLLALGGETFALLVDELSGEQEVLLKAQSALLESVRNVAGATILDSGEVCMVLDTQDLLHAMRQGATLPAPALAPAELPKKVILLAEDSIATRTLEARILQGAGYQVVTAADGLEAWNQLQGGKFDAVVTDIMMPRLTGLELTARIRAEARYANLPVILVTSLATSEDRRHGLEAGANAYLPKGTFDQQVLLDCLESLI